MLQINFFAALIDITHTSNIQVPLKEKIDPKLTFAKLIYQVVEEYLGTGIKEQGIEPSTDYLDQLAQILPNCSYLVANQIYQADTPLQTVIAATTNDSKINSINVDVLPPFAGG